MPKQSKAEQKLKSDMDQTNNWQPSLATLPSSVQQPNNSTSSAMWSAGSGPPPQSFHQQQPTNTYTMNNNGGTGPAGYGYQHYNQQPTDANQVYAAGNTKPQMDTAPPVGYPQKPYGTMMEMRGPNNAGGQHFFPDQQHIPMHNMMSVGFPNGATAQQRPVGNYGRTQPEQFNPQHPMAGQQYYDPSTNLMPKFLDQPSMSGPVATRLSNGAGAISRTRPYPAQTTPVDQRFITKSRIPQHNNFQNSNGVHAIGQQYAHESISPVHMQPQYQQFPNGLQAMRQQPQQQYPQQRPVLQQPQQQPQFVPQQAAGRSQRTMLPHNLPSNPATEQLQMMSINGSSYPSNGMQLSSNNPMETMTYGPSFPQSQGQPQQFNPNNTMMIRNNPVPGGQVVGVYTAPPPVQNGGHYDGYQGTMQPANSPFQSSYVMNTPLEIKQIPNPMMCNAQNEMFNPAIQPFIPTPDEEPCMTFPVRDRDEPPILPPFRLEHGFKVSNHPFALRPETYQSLMSNPALQLELKCYHHQDGYQLTNWPEAISICINNTPVAIERAPPGSTNKIHKSLLVKQLCRPNKKNIITITASACCCSHLFLLQLVHRPTFRFVMNDILKKRVLAKESCIEKLKRNFIGGNRGFSAAEELLVPLRCPITQKRMTTPARGSNCAHTACWDLETYLRINCDRNIFKCPLCQITVLIEHIEIDQFFYEIIRQLANLGDPTDEILVDANGGWKSNQTRIKEEVVRYNPISPSTTSTVSWDNSPSSQHSGYPQELPRSLSTGRNTPKGPNSVGHPFSVTSDYGSPATVPVSPGAKAFQNSHSSCPQKSPTPSANMDSRTPVPQLQSVHSGGSNGSMPSTPRTPGSQPASNNPASDFLDFNFESSTDAEALQLLSDMDPQELFTFLDVPLQTSSSFPNSTGNASDSGISNVSSSTANLSDDDLKFGSLGGLFESKDPG